MRVYIADEASPIVSRYSDIAGVGFPVNLLVTCNGSAPARARIIDKACTALSPESLFVDSGAFIIKSAYFKTGKGYSKRDCEDIIIAHLGACRWLVEHDIPLHAVAEMDLQEMFGLDTVKRWRDLYMFPFQDETGVPVVFAAHYLPHESDDSIEYLVQDPDVHYIGMTMRVKAVDLDAHCEMAALAAELCYVKGIRLHGYAVTRPKILKRVPFYSCDSVTWQSAIHFGGAMAFDQITGSIISVDAGKGLVKRKGATAVAKNILRLQSYGSKLKPLDVVGRKMVKGRPRADNHAIFRDQAKVFADMSRYFTTYWRLRGFDWDTPEDGCSDTKKDEEKTQGENQASQGKNPFDRGVCETPGRPDYWRGFGR